jgi:hypothetical protein
VSRQIPSPEALEEIRARTLAYISAHRRCKELYPKNPTGPNPEFWSARTAETSARSRLEPFFKESGAMEPLGWPEDVTSTLRKIALMFGGVLGSPTPDEIPGLEDDVKSLATGRAGPSDASPSPPEAAAQPDEIAIANALGAKGYHLEAAFVRHFKGRQSTAWDDLVEAVCPGEERSWSTVGTWANRVHNALLNLPPDCRLRFRMSSRGHLIIKTVPPE